MREKQIEELTNELVFTSNYGTYNAVANYLVNKGYRKQSEGEWIKSKSGLFVCSVCGTTCPYDAQADDISYWECKFCPNCGAKMKGGAE